MPTVSVILPVRDGETTILESVRSVLGQTLRDLELLVIDDGSRDGTPAALASLRDPRLTVLRQEREGVSRARNRGLEQARGEFLTFIDADDLWTADKLESQLRALRADPAAGAAYSWTVFVDGRGRFLFPKERSRSAGDVHADLVEHDFLASASNALARRSCVEAAGPFDGQLEPAEDWAFWLRAAAAWPFVVVPRYQVLYRFSPESHSSRPAVMRAAMRKVVAQALVGAPERSRARESAALAGIEQYVSFLYLARTRGPGARTLAGRHLARCVRSRPRSFWTWKVQALLALWLASLLVPARRVHGFVHGALAIYGRALRLLGRGL